MTREQKIRYAFLDLVLMPTVAANHLAFSNFGLQQKRMQVPHHFVVSQRRA